LYVISTQGSILWNKSGSYEGNVILDGSTLYVFDFNYLYSYSLSNVAAPSLQDSYYLQYDIVSAQLYGDFLYIVGQDFFYNYIQAVDVSGGFLTSNWKTTFTRNITNPWVSKPSVAISCGSSKL
jgi:hypothetical protein